MAHRSYQPSSFEIAMRCYAERKVVNGFTNLGETVQIPSEKFRSQLRKIVAGIHTPLRMVDDSLNLIITYRSSGNLAMLLETHTFYYAVVVGPQGLLIRYRELNVEEITKDAAIVAFFAGVGELMK